MNQTITDGHAAFGEEMIFDKEAGMYPSFRQNSTVASSGMVSVIAMVNRMTTYAFVIDMVLDRVREASCTIRRGPSMVGVSMCSRGQLDARGGGTVANV